MEFRLRRYSSEADFERIRSFLRQVFRLNGRRMFSWSVIRWDYWRWHGILNLGDGKLESDVFLWETADGQLAGVLNRENSGHAFLQVHPSLKTADLEEQMIIQAEESLRRRLEHGERALWVWSAARDEQREAILKQRGYLLTSDEEHSWHRDLTATIPVAHLYDGYVMRALGDESELPARSWASWRAFHSDEPDEHYQKDWSWYKNIQAAPLYRRDLDLVVIAPTHEIAAFTTLWYDELNYTGCFEPVGCVPEHQRRGLASALLFEGMKRLKQLGADRAMVGGEAPHANAFYATIFEADFDLYRAWVKRWREE